MVFTLSNSMPDAIFKKCLKLEESYKREKNITSEKKKLYHLIYKYKMKINLFSLLS